MTLCGGRAFRLGDCPQRAPKIVDEQIEIGGEDIAPPDDDDISIERCIVLAGRGDGGPEPALDPVALGGVADPLRNREAEAQPEA